MQIISLDDHFKEACGKHPHLKLLESQWRFDEELIAKALQNVSSIFPHYSRHDASHSRQIIVNIERMLGEKIRYLTATDAWLIMEAAYNHDIGMVVTQKQLEDMDSSAFELYVKDIVSQPENPLHHFACEWQNDKAHLPKGAESHAFFNKYIQLIAEWYRKKHPENSAKIIANPVDEIGLNSPRNELLPKRLFGVLSKICQAHGQGFSEVMQLPFSEAGMASEDCHPRYVACLLRMADLLDLDDNRFCPVMLHMCGKNFPKLSKSHLDKHHSITHFRLDSERIEVESECPSPEAYEVAFEWFKWLESEYHQQTQHWDKIVPSKLLGNLPTLTTPSVTIKEPFLVLEKGRKPNFRVDQRAVLELVRSTGLYTSKFDSIREVLQNAVDATLIAIWGIHKHEIAELNPVSPRLREIYDQYPILVDFDEDLDGKLIRLRVKDHGTGIDFETLQYMLEVGATYKNKSKQTIIDEMPVWYRPSGNFGIGLQSIYLISDKFTIKSKSRITHEALRVNFSRRSDKSVVIKKIPPSIMEYGTTLEMKIKIKKFPETMQFRPYDHSSLAQKLDEYDFTKPGANLRCYEMIKIFESIATFNQESPIKIKYLGAKGSEPEISYFCEKSNVVLSNIRFSNREHPKLHTSFRGQPIEGFNYIFYFLNASVDFYGYSAKDFVTYNREKILPHAASKARRDVITAVLSYIDRKYSDIPDAQKPYAAALYLTWSDSVNDVLEKDLLRLKIQFTDGSEKTLHDVISGIKAGDSITTPGFGNSPAKSSSVLARTSNPVLNIIMHYASKNGFHHQMIARENFGEETYLWVDRDIQPLSDDLFRGVLSQQIEATQGVGSRLLFPCWGEYRKLAIKAKISWAKVFSPRGNFNDMMVLPCHFFHNQPDPAFHDNEELAQWVYENRKSDCSPAEILKLYNELSLHLKSILTSAS